MKNICNSFYVFSQKESDQYGLLAWAGFNTLHSAFWAYCLLELTWRTNMGIIFDTTLIEAKKLVASKKTLPLLTAYDFRVNWQKVLVTLSLTLSIQQQLQHSLDYG